jgi:hypothetical protein
VSIIISALTSMGLKLLTASVIEKVTLIGLRELAKSTKSNVDDELYAIAEKKIKGE